MSSVPPQKPPLGLLFALAALCAVCSSSSAAAGWFTFMGDSGSVGPGSSGPGSSGPSSVIIDHCKGLSNNSPASNVSVACLRQTLKGAGCVESGGAYKWITDDYDGWWRKDTNGAGTFEGIKTDMKSYAAATSGDKYIACKGDATPCAGLTDTSPASTVPVACLRKTLKDTGGCVESGSIYKGLTDDYNGWWRQDNGAGTFGVIKTDMRTYGDATSGDIYIGCKLNATDCAGVTAASLASTVPVACLRKTLKDTGGCVESGSIYKGLTDDYNGWWRQDNGAGTFGNVITDMRTYAAATSGDIYIGCKGT